MLYLKFADGRAHVFLFFKNLYVHLVAQRRAESQGRDSLFMVFKEKIKAFVLMHPNH
jgi:hypothetical protein